MQHLTLCSGSLGGSFCNSFTVLRVSGSVFVQSFRQFLESLGGSLRRVINPGYLPGLHASLLTLGTSLGYMPPF